MDMQAPIDPADLLTPAAAGRAGGAPDRRNRPLLTYHDDATGERTALTADDLGGWAARTANLLAGCGLGRGDRAVIGLPPHWRTAAVLLGTWSAGLSVFIDLAATAGLARLGAGARQPFDVAFVNRDSFDDWLVDVPEARHRFAVDLARTGTVPTSFRGGAAARQAARTARWDRQVPDGWRDYLVEVDAQPVRARRQPAAHAEAAASVDGTTYRQWGGLALEMAGVLGIQPGERVLIDAARFDHPVKWLLAPLAVGASVVLCAHLDPASVPDRITAERVTRVL